MTCTGLGRWGRCPSGNHWYILHRLLSASYSFNIACKDTTFCRHRQVCGVFSTFNRFAGWLRPYLLLYRLTEAFYCSDAFFLRIISKSPRLFVPQSQWVRTKTLDIKSDKTTKFSVKLHAVSTKTPCTYSCKYVYLLPELPVLIAIAPRQIYAKNFASIDIVLSVICILLTLFLEMWLCNILITSKNLI